MKTVTNERELINAMDSIGIKGGMIYLASGTYHGTIIQTIRQAIRKKRKRIKYLSYRKCKSQRKYL